MESKQRSALIVVDLQNDFVEGGALAVQGGRELAEIANRLMPCFDVVVATQDWHPQDHESFASQHADLEVGQSFNLHGLPQIAWPDHCVQGTLGAELLSDLNASSVHRIFRKGTEKSIDSYSGFFDNGHRRSTGLADYLRSEDVRCVAILGIATDYCVRFTALDAAREGFSTLLIEDACRGVELAPGDIAAAIAEMQKAGVQLFKGDAWCGSQ